jgi:DNA-binding NarL/FixJ family response regulator
MKEKVRVAILDDHPAIVEGYKHYLSREIDIKVVASAAFGDELEPMLAEYSPIHLLILDVNVPTSSSNSSRYPIFHLIPKLLQHHPAVKILVISMYKQSSVIRAAIEAGASGFLLKDDRDALEALGSIIRTVAGGGVHFSREAHQMFFRHTALLTTRQMEVLSLCAAYPNESIGEIARLMGLAEATVRNLLSYTYSRLGVRSRTAAVARAEELGLIATPDHYPLTNNIP